VIARRKASGARFGQGERCNSPPPQGFTRTVADWIGKVADFLRQRKVDTREDAHFLMKVLFCFFAEDQGESTVDVQ